MREGKFVKIIAPGGAVLNFVGVTGTTEKALLEITSIAKLLNRGCEVFEIKEEAQEGKEPKVTYTPLYNAYDEAGKEKFTEKQKEDFEKRGFKACDTDNGGKKQIDSKELEAILITDIEDIVKQLIDQEEKDRETAVGEKLKIHIAELNAQETVETTPKTEEEVITEKASARFKKHFEDLVAEEKAKTEAAAKSEEEKAKETAFDKGAVYRQLPRFGNKPSSSTFRYAADGSLEPDTHTEEVHGEDSHTTVPPTPAIPGEHTATSETSGTPAAAGAGTTPVNRGGRTPESGNPGNQGQGGRASSRSASTEATASTTDRAAESEQNGDHL
mgnify:CR=1 FL=1